MDGLKEVGHLCDLGKMFLLQAAKPTRVMKQAVTLPGPFMEAAKARPGAS